MAYCKIEKELLLVLKSKKSKKYSYSIFEKIENKNYYVKDVLSDLPKINPGEKIEGLNKYTKKLIHI
ncbi:hypothetical protein [Campylobacter cuniculorum]|uniref:hypothetical protein n=1 Tax=Campylobacter cuniculorum TaxID=374106 RepID=UPI0023EFA0A9|nr:hypothetical protein [Campylobacter cuniculorum]